MIYLIESPAMEIIDGEKKYFSILKIGYTDDANKDKRYSNYKYHNMTMRVLNEIPNATLDDEQALHFYFKDLLYMGNEWYRYDNKILEFFKTHTTADSLNFLPKIHRLNQKARVDYIEKVINRWFCIDSINTRGLDCEKVIKNLIRIINSVEGLFKYLEDNYEITCSAELIDYMTSPIDKELEPYLSEFNMLPNFLRKLRYLCETDFKKEILDSLLDSIPFKYKNYYLTLGPERCKALSYHQCELEQEFKDLQIDNSPELTIEINNNFIVSQKYTKAEIKAKLAKIFKSIGYHRIAKASLLSDYFDLKTCKIKNENGEWNNGFEILGKK